MEGGVAVIVVIRGPDRAGCLDLEDVEGRIGSWREDPVPKPHVVVCAQPVAAHLIRVVEAVARAGAPEAIRGLDSRLCKPGHNVSRRNLPLWTGVQRVEAHTEPVDEIASRIFAVQRRRARLVGPGTVVDPALAVEEGPGSRGIEPVLLARGGAGMPRVDVGDQRGR